jgi:diguanylate cyclase (GGDEF)-like protein
MKKSTGKAAMNMLVHLELNLFAIAILMIMVCSRRCDFTYSLDQRLLQLAMIANAVTLVFDIIFWVANGAAFPLSGAVLALGVYFYYVCNLLTPMMCLIYCDYKIFGSVRDLRKRLRAYILPLIFICALLAVNLRTGWFYRIDDMNRYVRGRAFAAVPLMMLIYPVWIEWITIRHGRNIQSERERAEVRKIGIYMLLPIACMALQIAMRGVQLVWISSVISFAMIYINIQNRRIDTDELTGLYNRRLMPRVFARMVESLACGNRLFVVMIDADDFKELNDTYGHAAGDRMLASVASKLDKVCAPRKDFLARLGGDEFVILALRGAQEEMRLIAEIYEAVSQLDDPLEPGCKFSISCGMAEYARGGLNTLDKLLTAADRAMYANKDIKKMVRESGI